MSDYEVKTDWRFMNDEDAATVGGQRRISLSRSVA